MLYLDYFIESAGEKLPKKIDAFRKGLFRAKHEIENWMVISFFFPLENPYMIDSFSTCILAVDNCSIAMI